MMIFRFADIQEFLVKCSEAMFLLKVLPQLSGFGESWFQHYGHLALTQPFALRHNCPPKLWTADVVMKELSHLMQYDAIFKHAGLDHKAREQYTKLTSSITRPDYVHSNQRLLHGLG